MLTMNFLGGAGEVTGSCYLIGANATQFLVDCGMFQGGADAFEKNHAPFAFDPTRLAFVALSHAHIDHSGLLPRLVAAGFTGPIYCTRATADLLAVMLPDSAHIQEYEAQWRAGRTRGRKNQRTTDSEPLYTVEQAQASLERLVAVDYESELRPAPEISLRFHDAGHILGAASVELRFGAGAGSQRVVISGDIGQRGRPIVRDPVPVEAADTVLIESTYGNRQHKSLPDTLEELASALNRTLKERRGNVIVPAFAVGRTQELLYVLSLLTREGRIDPPQVFVDSPMATRATEITLKHLELLDTETRHMVSDRARDPLFRNTRFIESAAESQALAKIRSGAVIIAASGMCDAGRIRHHLRNNLARPECSVLFTGFQAEGTLGRRIVDQARVVQLFGEDIPVRASVHTIGGLSAHADQQGLLDWLRGFKSPPRQTFVVHGELATATGFAELIRRELGWDARVPQRGQHISLQS